MKSKTNKVKKTNKVNRNKKYIGRKSLTYDNVEENDKIIKKVKTD